MTELDEALRALDKAIELVENSTRGPWTFINEKADDCHDAPQPWYSCWAPINPDDGRALIAAVNFIREHGRSLLTTRQEVAPVAWGVRSVHAERGDLWMCDFGLATIWKEDAVRYAEWANDNRKEDGPFVVVNFHESTGQTSDARDGDVICIGSDSVVSHTHPDYGKGLFFTEDAIMESSSVNDTRYRWLRTVGVRINSWDVDHRGVYQEDALDNAIDAAMQEAGK